MLTNYRVQLVPQKLVPYALPRFVAIKMKQALMYVVNQRDKRHCAARTALHSG